MPYTAATPERVSAVTAAISPAVVRVDIAQAHYENGKQSLLRGNGSGVIIDQQGRILTNYHVAGRAIEIYVTLYTKERVPAKLIGDDHWTDLAIIQMDMDLVRKQNIQFSSAQLGDSGGLVVGQDVMAFGTPFGLARTVTRGSVSNTDRTFFDQPQRMDIDGIRNRRFFQLDSDGRSDQPRQQRRSAGGPERESRRHQHPRRRTESEFRDPHRHGQTGDRRHPPNRRRRTGKGRVDRSDLGFELMPMHELEAFYDIDINKGVLINSVDRIGPYADAGGKAQDILLAVNGQPTNVRFPEEMAAVRKRIASLPIGKEVELTIKRGKTDLDAHRQDRPA